MAEHEDKASDVEDLRPVVEGLVQAIQRLAEEIDGIKGGHSALEKLVVDDLIGGIHTMYKTNMKNGRIESLKSKYGDLMGPHFEALSGLIPEGTDHWSAIHDLTEGMDDDETDQYVKGMSEGLKSKIDAIRKAGGPNVEAKVDAAIEASGEDVAPPAPAEEEVEPEVKSKDQLAAERLKNNKGFKLR